MTPEEFYAACVLLWGFESPMAGATEFLGISRRNAQHFARGTKRVGPDIRRQLLAEIASALKQNSGSTQLALIQEALGI